MRNLAAAGAHPCDISNGQLIPSDLIAANCIPPGFMVQSGWDIVCNYYQNVESDQWTPYSVQTLTKPYIANNIKTEGKFGSINYKVYISIDYKFVSPWHDISMHTYPHTLNTHLAHIFNFICEIPMYYTSKMEMMKKVRVLYTIYILYNSLNNTYFLCICNIIRYMFMFIRL